MTHNNLSIRLILDPLIMTISCEMPDDQARLKENTRAFIKQELVALEAPQMKPETWDQAVVEIVSDITLERIKRLEALLHEALDEGISDDLAERIEDARMYYWKVG